MTEKSEKNSHCNTVCHSVEIAEILSNTFPQKFRESNGLTGLAKEITK